MHDGATVQRRNLPAKMLGSGAQALPTELSVEVDDGLHDLMQLVAEPSDPVLPAQGIDLRAHLERIERSLIEQALATSGHVIAHAAGKLGLRRTTLVEKIRKHGLRADTGTKEIS
jgi:sigma-54 specific flagellar transcriptional regulator A